MRDYSAGLSVSIIGHVLLLLLFSFNLVFVPHKPAPLVKLAIEASLVDPADVPTPAQQSEQRRQIEQQRMLDEQRRAEEERRKEEQRQLEVRNLS